MNPICFIIPPSPFLLDERVFMSLGILKVAAVLEREHIPVEILDLSGISNWDDALIAHLGKTDADKFALTATTPQMPQAAKAARIISAYQRDVRLILGGPHSTLTHAAFKKEMQRNISGRAHRAQAQLEDLFDVIVCGDGEEAIFHAIGDNPPLVIDADDPKSNLFLTSQRLNETPFPARHLVDVESYHYQVDGERALSLIAQLGCPFQCGFCGGRNSPMLRRVRMRTTENIVSEMTHLYETYGVKGFMMYDDELNVNPQMISLMNAISDVQESLGVEFRLRGFVKAQLFTDQQAIAMRQAGFRWILTGFESGSPRILENINKRSTQEENTRCIDIAQRHGLKVKALMSLGHPGESLETIQSTKNWLMMTKPNDFDVTIITPYPGSPYYDDARQDDKTGDWIYVSPNGDKLYAKEVDYFKTADYYKGDPNGGYRSYVYTENLSCGTLVEERDRLERTIRRRLAIPFNESVSAKRFEHSMGMTVLPDHILRTAKQQEALPC